MERINSDVYKKIMQNCDQHYNISHILILLNKSLYKNTNKLYFSEIIPFTIQDFNNINSCIEFVSREYNDNVNYFKINSIIIKLLWDKIFSIINLIKNSRNNIKLPITVYVDRLSSLSRPSLLEVYQLIDKLLGIEINGNDAMYIINDYVPEGWNLVSTFSLIPYSFIPNYSRFKNSYEINDPVIQQDFTTYQSFSRFIMNYIINAGVVTVLKTEIKENDIFYDTCCSLIKNLLNAKTNIQIGDILYNAENQSVIITGDETENDIITSLQWKFSGGVYYEINLQTNEIPVEKNKDWTKMFPITATYLVDALERFQIPIKYDLQYFVNQK